MTPAPEATNALVQAADAARRAPSMHNTQPWRWRVASDVLELYADRDRQLTAVDPDGRLLTLSCGSALHLARVALAAEGWTYEVERPAREPLARVRALAHGPTDPAAMHRYQTTLLRHTDRRPVRDEPVDPTAVEAVAVAAQAEGARLHVLGPDQVVELAVAVEHAQRAEGREAAFGEELGRWVGGERGEGAGVPDAAIPAAAPQSTVAQRDFGRAGSLPVGSGHDTTAVYAVLYGDGDEPADWLRAGEALHAAWLVAIEHGLTVLPISAPAELPGTRQLMRSILADVGYPYLALRLGAADPDHAGPPHPPRLQAEQVIEVADGG